MRNHKIIFYCALCISILAISIVLIDIFYINSYKEWLKDILLAVFSSAVFVTIVSIIEYFSAKRMLLKDINNLRRAEQNGWNLILFAIKQNNTYNYTEQGACAMVKSSNDAWMQLEQCLIEYNKGCFIGDQELRDLITKVNDGIIRNINLIKIPMKSFDAKTYLDSNQKINEAVSKWLRGKGIDSIKIFKML